MLQRDEKKVIKGMKTVPLMQYFKKATFIQTVTLKNNFTIHKQKTDVER
jgi:hypothetical protein